MHCRRCGTRTTERGDESPHPWCPTCRRPDYHNPAPAVGVAILRGGRVLLSQRAAAPKKSAWDLVGGFVEPGESAEHALLREVLEETGLRLDAYLLREVEPGDYDEQPTLNLLYTGRAEGEPRAADDSEALQWWPLAGLPDELAWPHEARFLRRLADGAYDP